MSDPCRYSDGSTDATSEALDVIADALAVPAALIIEGECRKPYPYEPHGRTCERGTYGCGAAHIVRREGTTCRYCRTDGGRWTCLECDRGLFSCSNYAGNGHVEAPAPAAAPGPARRSLRAAQTGRIRRP